MGDWMCPGLAANTRRSCEHVLWMSYNANLSLSVDISSCNSFRAWDYNLALVPRAWSSYGLRGRRTDVSQAPSDHLLTLAAEEHDHNTLNIASFLGRTAARNYVFKSHTVPDNLYHCVLQQGRVSWWIPATQNTETQLILAPTSLREKDKGFQLSWMGCNLQCRSGCAAENPRVFPHISNSIKAFHC